MTTPEKALASLVSCIKCREPWTESMAEAELIIRRALAPPFDLNQPTLPGVLKSEVLAEGRGWQESASMWVVVTDPDHLVGGPSRPVLIVAAPEVCNRCHIRPRMYMAGHGETDFCSICHDELLLDAAPEVE